MSNGNVGLYPTADHWCFGRCYLQSWSTCHILTAVFLRFTRNMTIEIGSLEIWLLAVGHRPRPQTKAEDFKCQLLMHCTLRIYIMNCNLQWWGTQFFFSHALFLWDFFHSIFFFCGCICSSHGTNISFAVFHWEWQKKSAAAADVLLKYKDFLCRCI